MILDKSKQIDFGSIAAMVIVAGAGAYIGAISSLFSFMGSSGNGAVILGLVLVLFGIWLRIFILSRNFVNSILGVPLTLVSMVVLPILFGPVGSFLFANFRRYEFSVVGIVFGLAVLVLMTKFAAFNFQKKVLMATIVPVVSGVLSVIVLVVVGGEVMRFVYQGQMRTISQQDQLIWMVFCSLVFSAVYVILNRNPT